MSGKILLMSSSAPQAALLPVAVTGLTARGFDVCCVLSPAASTQWVNKAALTRLTKNNVYTGWSESDGVALHRQLVTWADVIAIYPATLNTASKICNNITDSLLVMLAVTAACPVILSPSFPFADYTEEPASGIIEQLRTKGIDVVYSSFGRRLYGDQLAKAEHGPVPVEEMLLHITETAKGNPK